MESRRQEDYGLKSSMQARLRNERMQRVPDPYSISRHALMERSPRLPRSLSPARRVERRDFYGWEVGGGNERGERMRFRSPSPTFDERLPNYERGFPNRNELRRRYEFTEYVDRKCELDNPLKHSGIKGNAEGNRVLATGGNQFLNQKQVALEDGRIAREAYRSLGEVEPALRRADDPVNLQLSSRNPDIRFKDERILYPDPYLLEKLSALERYGKGEKYTFHSKDPSYSGSTTLTKDFSDTAELREFSGNSMQSSRENIVVSQRDGMPLAREVYARSSIQQTEEFSSFEHNQRHSSERRGDPESSRKDLLGYRWGSFSPSRAEEREYLCPRHQLEKIDYSYPSENFGNKMPSIEPEYYNERDFTTPDLVKFSEEHMGKAEYSQGLHRSSSSWDHQSFQGQSSSNYFPANRGRILVDQDGAHRERLRKTPHNPYYMGAQTHDLEKKGMRSYEVDAYNCLKGSIKRKDGTDKELSRHSTRGTISSKANNVHIVKSRRERFEEWNDEDGIDLLLPRSSEYYNDMHRRATNTFDVVQHDGDSTPDDWLSYCDAEDYVQEHSTKLIKPGKRNLKGHCRPGLSNGYDSCSFKKHRFTKNVWLRDKDDEQLDECAIDAQELDNLPSSFKSGPTEDSEEFKQMVNTFFLAFSKKLNASPATQKRYKEQGRAGPLFCIVCGQSVSKEFKDTKGLVIHCYMSKKAGLRARHLGLHKAICVLLGWESVVAPDVTTPIPQAISVSEALTQKEDLILWPPVVVIHYISPGAQKIFTKEAVEDFLRGKGFSVGKIKVCLGMSVNNSVMLVKFLGTFSGLQEAEKLHKYFMHDKRGRTDLQQITVSKGKASNCKEGRMQGEKLEEPVLYGYIGIAEDLEKVDYDSKRRCLIKSKKEIQDFANAPI